MTLQEIDEMVIIEPYCFENEQEEQWYKVGLREGADAAIKQLGWHSAVELPKKPTSKLGRIIVLTLDGKLGFNYYVDGWDMSNVKWWCYPPKED